MAEGLSGEAYEQLTHALVDAFPSEDALRRMLRFQLDKSLDEITKPGSLTEAEWEYAARGSDEQQTYPWGNDEPSSQLCWNGQENDFGRDNRLSNCEAGKYKKGNSRWGALDMADNVREWTATGYCHYDSYGNSNCTDRDFRVVRGGRWGAAAAFSVRAVYREYRLPAYRDSSLGFRCARTLQQ